MDSLTDRIKRSFAQRGLVGTVRMCWDRGLTLMLPNRRQREVIRREMDAMFDRNHGVDTAGSFRPTRGEVVGSNWELGNHYEAVEPPSFAEALGRVPIRFPEFTFIDFGSGKGRSLLLASEFAFKRIIGVEFCPELNRVARENVRRYPASATRCQQIEVVDADAAEFQLPNEPLVLFLNNPFARPLMAKVVHNTAESFRLNPRQIIVIYFWPFFADVWETAGFLKRVQSAPAIFQIEDMESRQSSSEELQSLTANGPNQVRRHA